MAMEKGFKLSMVNNKNGTLKSLSDPKFLHKCFVSLENCDFSEYYIVSSEVRDPSKQSTDNKKSVSTKKTRELNDLSIDHDKIFNENTYGSLSDPKFLYKCFVSLENCDFSKYSIVSSEGTDPLEQSTDNKNSVDHDKIFKENTFESILMEKERNITKTVPLKNKLTDTIHSTMQSKNIGMKSTGISEKNVTDKRNEDALCLVEGKSLRARKKVNYKERKSIGTPDVSKNISLVEGKRIPIYRKEVMNSPKSRKRKGDLYDFKPESEEDKDSDVSFKIDLPVKKKRKVNKQVHFHKQVTHENLNCAKINGGKKVLKYNDKINRIMNRFTEKLKSKEESTATISRKQTERDQVDSNDKTFSHSVFNSTMLPDSRKIILLDQSVIAKGLTDHIAQFNIMGTKQIDKTKNVSIPCSENSSLSSRQIEPSDSSSLEALEDMSMRSFGDDNLENLFGFADDLEENRDKEKTINQINVQDVINGSSFPKHYMSTPKRFQEKKSWRFDTKIVNRNPHFLAVKKNSLPALSQDPVLDHTFDERIDMVNKMVLVSSNKKSTKQQSILNYIEASKEYSDDQNHSQSLYDIAELSPIKYKDADKENSLEKKKLSNENQRPKRNILGMINEDNLKNKSLSKNNEELVGQIADAYSSSNNKKGKTSEEPENFGFDSISEDVEDERVVEQRPKPFRIEFTYKKCDKRKKLTEISTKPVRDSEVRRLIEKDPGFEEVVDKDGLDCGELGLFEDIERSPDPMKNYKCPRKKITDQATDKNKAPKMKLSKEAKKWIHQFNEMCDEVENEVLEIE